MVFGDCGYAATTMEAVAEKAGISKGSIYNYFQNKKDLFKSVFLRSVTELEAQSRHILESKKPAVQRIDDLIEFWFNRLSYHKHIGQLVLECWATAARQDEAGDLAVMPKDQFGVWRDQLSAVLRQGVEAGEFGQVNPAVASSLMLAILNGVEVQLMLDVGLVVDVEFIEALKRAIVSALRAGAGAPVRREGESHE